MFKFSMLMKDLPSMREPRMMGAGYAVWMVWRGDLADAIPRTFQDYGGMRISEDRGQSLWFFFTKDVFHGLARLQVWAKMNALPVYVQVLPAKLLVGFQLEITLSVASELFTQQAMVPDEFAVWIHPQVRQDAENIPGVTLEDVESITGLASASWRTLRADPRLSFGSTLGWYFILKPLGNPLDKAFIEGWRNFFGELQRMLTRMKLKYILHSNYLIFQLDSYRTLRQWCLDILQMIRASKSSDEGVYWPSVMAAVEKGGLHFNEELPNKVALDWNQMTPDFPHMTYRTAFLLGAGFKIKDVSYSLERSKLTDWCYAHLAEGDLAQVSGSLQVSMPVALLAGPSQPCFYCGLRNHTENQCPSRELNSRDLSAWTELALLPMEGINSGLKELGDAVKDNPLAAISAMLKGGEPPRVILRALYEINAYSQFRSMHMVWRCLGEDMPDALAKLAPAERHPYVVHMENVLAGDPLKAERMARQESLRAPRDFQYYDVQAVICLERGEFERAQGLFKEGDLVSQNALQYAYHRYMQGRLAEVQGNFDQAMTAYRQASELAPKWLEPAYRQAASMVKMGFSEHALPMFDDLIQRDPNVFNRILIDPELERGAIHLMSFLWGRWMSAKEEADASKKKLEELSEEFGEWFGRDSDFGRENQEVIRQLLELHAVDNYVAMIRMISGHGRLLKILKNKVDAEVRVIQRQGEEFKERLKDIHKEVSWFPFPKTLREFNKDFNFCVQKLKWVKEQHFQIAENFRRSREFYDQVDEKLTKLSRSLVTLKIVRDSTLFAMILGKSFMWLEIIGLGLALVTMPVIVYFAEQAPPSFWRDIIVHQKWGLQKGLIIVLSVMALTISLLRTALVFDKKKAKLFEEYENQERTAREAKRRR
ncbi:MAG: tetratricopeptide repeat protein [Thermodesulfobacteriota bacterium]